MKVYSYLKILSLWVEILTLYYESVQKYTYTYVHIQVSRIRILNVIGILVQLYVENTTLIAKFIFKITCNVITKRIYPVKLTPMNICKFQFSSVQDGLVQIFIHTIMCMCMIFHNFTRKLHACT